MGRMGYSRLKHISDTNIFRKVLDSDDFITGSFSSTRKQQEIYECS